MSTRYPPYGVGTSHVIRLRTRHELQYGPVMRCAVCGHPGVEAGDGHLCRLDGDDSRAALGPPPSSAWRVLSSVVLAVTIGYVAVCAVKIGLLVQDYNLVDLLTSSTGTVTMSQLTGLATWERTVATLQELLVLAYVVGFIAW